MKLLHFYRDLRSISKHGRPSYMLFSQTMECRPTVPDRKLLARLVLIREEARTMMGGGLLDERNDRGFTTLPEAEVANHPPNS